MSHRFTKGNVYIFTKKKYVEHCGKSIYAVCKHWVDACNGKEVFVYAKDKGACGEYSVAPQWCKCIKVGNNKNMGE